jgi:sarcosine oxidase subunit delta
VQLECPLCGLRDHAEFIYGGEVSARPDLANDDLERWSAYVFLRDNPRGLHREYWHHALGCRQWLILERDTLNHKVASVRLVRDARPAGGAA